MEIIFHSFIGAIIALFFKVIYDIGIHAKNTNLNRRILIAYIKNTGLEQSKDMIKEYKHLNAIRGATSLARTKDLIKQSQFDAYPMLNMDMFRALKFSELRSLSIHDKDFMVLNTFVHCFEHQLKFLPCNLLKDYVDDLDEHLQENKSDDIAWENEDIHFERCDAIQNIKSGLQDSINIGQQRTIDNIEAMESILNVYDNSSDFHWLLKYSFKT